MSKLAFERPRFGVSRHLSAATWLVALLGVFSGGCADPTTQKPQAPPPATVAVPLSPIASSTPSAPEPAAPADVPSDVPSDVLVGTVQLNTKGGRPTVAGRMLDSTAFQKRFGDGWRKLVDSKRIRAVGRFDAYDCQPMEQCLVGGFIYSLKDIQSIELCEPAAALKSRTTENPKVSCPQADTAAPSPPTLAPGPSD